MNKHDLINQLAAEDPTPGVWQTVIADAETDTSVSIMVIKPEAAGKAHDKLDADDLIQVAWFPRPADQRRVMACLRQFASMPTDAIESMPGDVRELVHARLYLTDMVRNVAQAAAGTEEEWAAIREHMQSINTARVETERQRARPN